MAIKTLKRTIHYYILDLTYNEDYEFTHSNKALDLLSELSRISKTRAFVKYQKLGNKTLFAHDYTFDDQTKLLTGKIRAIRQDLLPELINTKTDATRDIDAKEEEGLVETTHFVIDYSKTKIKLGLESNFQGAKIYDFIYYFNKLGISAKIIKDIKFAPFTKDELDKIAKKINRCSSFTVKVYKDHIPDIKNIDNGLYTSLKSAIDQFKSDYATLTLKFDYKTKSSTDSMVKTVKNLITSFTSNKENTYLFNTVNVKAENIDNKNKLEIFDLLIDKIKSEITVQKRERTRIIVSLDMYAKMKEEFIKLKL